MGRGRPSYQGWPFWLIFILSIGYPLAATLLVAIDTVPLISLVGVNLGFGTAMMVVYRHSVSPKERSVWFITGFYLVPPIAGIEYCWQRLGVWRPATVKADESLIQGSRNGILTIGAAYVVILAAGILLGSSGDHFITFVAVNAIFGTWMVYFLRHHARSAERPLHPLWYPLVYLFPPLGGGTYLLYFRIVP